MMTATCSPPDLCPPSNTSHVNCGSNQNLWENWTTEIPLVLQQVRTTWTGSQDTAKGKLCQKEGCLFCLAITINNRVKKKQWQQKKQWKPLSCTLCPHAPQTGQIVPALPGTLQVEAEDLKVPQEKSVFYLARPLPAPWLISHAPLGIFQDSPIGKILPLWEKCNIWLVKLTVTSAADNQRTAYLLNSPSQERAAKESAWVTLLNQPKNPSLGCYTASLHPSQPIISPLQEPVSKGLWSAPREHLSLSPVPSTSLLCWTVTIIVQKQQNPGEVWVTLPHWEGMDRTQCNP